MAFMRNLKDFTIELNKLKQEAIRDLSSHDLNHLRKVIWVNRLFIVIGYLTAWIFPNPISMVALSLHLTGSWTIVAHHICHSGYNNVPGVPERYKSKVFAMGIRRFLDWPDCFYPPAWKYEHNVLHHCYVNEYTDPDQISYRKTPAWLLKMPKLVKWFRFCIIVSLWKFQYYCFSTMQVFHEKKNYKHKLNFRKYLWPVMKKSILPYVLLHFVVIPLCFLPLGLDTTLFVLINRIGAEIITNWHTFFIIVPNHTGSDLALHDSHFKTKEGFYLRQITSTCNAKTGGFWNDYFHGYLNYQIEHHLFPNLPPSQYVKIQPKVEKICSDFNIPYVQESIFKRIKKMFNIMKCLHDMKVMRLKN